MDAQDFFDNDNVLKTRAANLAFEETSGCKRSSIIRIRTEKKGLVSRSVDTFSKPALPPPMITPRKGPRPPARTPASAVPSTSSAATRRNSARMGVAGKASYLTPGASTTRRQTLTGIKTSATASPGATDARRQSISNRSNTMTKPQDNEPIYGNIEPLTVKKGKSQQPPKILPRQSPRVMSDNTKAVKAANLTNVTPRREGQQPRKSKRIDGRRFLTIGYEGEVRSPLRDRKNTPSSTNRAKNKANAKVQRSKSAQTTLMNNKNCAKIQKRTANDEKENQDEIFCQNVQRSLSLRSPRPPIVVPASLKETIYDVTTPKSEKVKRHLSDRVMTPRGGRQEAVPFIKDVLTKSRTTPNNQSYSNHRTRLRK